MSAKWRTYDLVAQLKIQLSNWGYFLKNYAGTVRYIFRCLVGFSLWFFCSIMGANRGTEKWFSSLWRTSRKTVSEPDKRLIGILAYEVASLMSRLVNLWNGLSDGELDRLKEEILNSPGVRKLVSEDDDYLMGLALAEIIENLEYVMRSTARLGKRCADPMYQHFECFFDDSIQNAVAWCGWEYKWKKMHRKAKKMQRFVVVSSQLYQEVEVLAELEQALRRMQGNMDLDRVKLLEFQQKVMLQRQEVKNLREMSPWSRSYDYTVRLLVRSVSTILERINYTFGTDQTAEEAGNKVSEPKNSDLLTRSQSVSALMQSSVYPSESSSSRFYSGPLGRSISKSWLTSDKERANNKQSLAHLEKHSHLRTKKLTSVGPFRGCMVGGNDSPILQSCTTLSNGSVKSNGICSKNIDVVNRSKTESLSHSKRIHTKVPIFNSKCRLSNGPASTLGDAGLALHYANVIISIERLASSPHLIDLDTRDDLYDSLPTTVRASLRTKLKLYAKNLESTVCDAALASDWSLALARILEWLAPLAHNMIRWHSERSYEKQDMVSRTNVLLVQTLYFANQAKTEATITELLVGLNYMWRFGRGLHEKALQESAGSIAHGDYLLQRFQ